MTDDTFANSARPPGVPIAWATKTELFVEFSTKDGPPYIARFPKTPNGLAAALNIICEAPAPAPPKPQAVKRSLPNFTQSQRDNAHAVLKRLKIV